MSFFTKELGKRGEDEAVRVLKKNGYKVIERNYSCRSGEIDIVALDGATVVFVEVKTRSGEGFGPGKESVDSRKRRHIIKASTEYLGNLKNKKERSVRFDVVSIELRPGKGVEVPVCELIKDAFGADW